MGYKPPPRSAEGTLADAADDSQVAVFSRWLVHEDALWDRALSSEQAQDGVEVLNCEQPHSPTLPCSPLQNGRVGDSDES